MGANPISAGAGAVTSIAGAAISGKGAKKAAKIQQQTAAQNRALLTDFYNKGQALYQPDIDQGSRASAVYSGLLGTGGDPAASQAALNTWQNSAGYQNTLNTGLAAVNANAYAQGMGRSGAAFKALQDRGAQVSNGYLQQYLGNLQTQVGNGLNAKGQLTGIGTNTTNGIINVNQGAADASSNAKLMSANAWSGAITSLGKLAGDNFGSSYKK